LEKGEKLNSKETETMKRTHLAMVLIFAVALLGIAATAQAQTSRGTGGDGGGGEVHVVCFCSDNSINTTEQCIESVICAGAIDCTIGGDALCGPLSICMDAANGCGFALCAPECPDEFNCNALHPFGSFPVIPFPDCPKNIPTLSQWGLILFGMLLLTTMFIVIRRRGLPTQMTASLLVLMAVGVLATGASYAEIQSNRVCGETDVAVEFVNDILNS